MALYSWAINNNNNNDDDDDVDDDVHLEKV